MNESHTALENSHSREPQPAYCQSLSFKIFGLQLAENDLPPNAGAPSITTSSGWTGNMLLPIFLLPICATLRQCASGIICPSVGRAGRACCDLTWPAVAKFSA
jgi:hypothetical protein